ncbi:hypothetical protein FBU30_009367 [Linnemannia zychae]|nr:hypothetical protein FBU30_009367 [Linnemannia zychae]
MSQLEVTVIRARNLKREDGILGHNDPYVRIAVDKGLIHKWQKTATCKDAGGEPEFNETMVFDIEPNQDLILEVKDDDLVHDDEIGRTKIPVAGVFETGGVESWYQIGKGSKYNGEVFLRMRPL